MQIKFANYPVWIYFRPMVLSILNEALAYKEKTSKELGMFFELINFKVFDKIFSKFTKQEPHFIIFYILYAYSEDSPWLIIGSDWKEEKVMIADRLQMPDYMRPWCVDMVDAEVRGAIVDYVDFQGRADYKALQLKQIQYDKITSAIVKQMDHDNEGNVDMSSLFEANKELDKLQVTIDKLKEDLKKKYNFVYIAVEEAVLAEKKTLNKLSGSIENSKWIIK